MFVYVFNNKIDSVIKTGKIAVVLVWTNIAMTMILDWLGIHIKVRIMPEETLCQGVASLMASGKPSYSKCNDVSGMLVNLLLIPLV